MKKRRVTALAVAFCLAAVTIAPGMQAGAVYAEERQETAIEGDYAEDEILVVFEDDVNKKEAQEVVEQQEGKDLTILDTPQEEVAAVVELPKKQDVEDAVVEYQKDPNVAYAQPNYRYQLAESSAKTAATTDSLNDSYRGSLWHLNTIQAKEAWDVLETKNTSKARVAVLDTGVDLDHPDLQENLLKNLCSDTSNGSRRQLTGDDAGHGTHVAGIIGATANNNEGTAGVASGASNEFVELFVVDIFQGEYAYTTGIVAGIEYAVDNGAKVINISAGYASPYTTFEDVFLENAVNNAVNSGTTVVCAAGNDNNTVTNYPADFDASISVISTTSANRKASSSNYGSAKDISAPGENILSTWPEGYARSSGTSMASPVVAGVAALLYAADSDISVSDVKNILYNSATDIYTSGWDSTSGYGIVNAYRAVTSQGTRYTVSYHLNGGKNNAANVTSYYGSLTLKNPTRRNYTFAGWYKDSSYKSRLYTLSGGNYTLYAKWKKVKVNRASIKSLKRRSARKAKVSYKKVSGAKGYQIAYSTSRKFKKSGTKYKTTTLRSKTLTRLKKNKTYYVKVRAYKKDSTGKKVYGKYSKVKKVKLKR